VVVKDDEGTEDLRAAAKDLKEAVESVRRLHDSWGMPSSVIPPSNPSSAAGWNFDTFEKYINQRFGDLSLQLRERYEAQQTGVTAALAAAEKAVNAALIAAEKAVDKAEGAQQLRNEAQNEFRKSLSDLSGLMWTTKEGTATVDSLRRELSTALNNLDTKITTLNSARTDSVESMRKALDARIAPLESASNNIQGRIWGVSALFAIAALVIDVLVHYIGH
jgi:hypothetical protein